jgi:glutamyl/glutaminyl-tRNA synthetase
MPSIRVYSSRRWNPKKKEWDYSIYYRTLESIERAGAEALSNWYGVEESDLDADGKILAKTVHKMMNPPDGKLIKVKPTIDALKAMKEVIPASELARQTEEKEKALSAFSEAVEEQLRENRGKQQGTPVQPTIRERFE